MKMLRKYPLYGVLLYFPEKTYTNYKCMYAMRKRQLLVINLLHHCYSDGLLNHILMVGVFGNLQSDMLFAPCLCGVWEHK